MDTKLHVYRDNKTLVVTTGNKVVADTASDDFTHSEQVTHAAFIVRAANSHDQIVAALQRLVAANDAYAGVFAKQDDEVALMVEYGEAMEAARAALAAADA